MKEILAVGTYIQPDDELVIDDLETLHVISDPLRLQLLAAIIDQPKPIKQIAAELKIDQIKLYYHFKMMEKHGLVKVVEERVISGIVEKVYRARARSLRVRDGLLSIGGRNNESVEALLGDVFDKPRLRLRKSLVEGTLMSGSTFPPQGRFFAARTSARLQPERAHVFFERVESLLTDFENQSTGPSFGDWYDLSASMVPIKSGSQK
jgi:DNA-binding transcriptional ArsR family regulator